MQSLSRRARDDAAKILEQLLDDVALTQESFLAGARRLVVAAHADRSTLVRARELLHRAMSDGRDSRVRAGALARLEIAIADIGEDAGSSAGE